MNVFGHRVLALMHRGQTRLVTAERGATGVEYGIMIAAIAAVIIVAAIALGAKAVTGLDFVNGKL